LNLLERLERETIWLERKNRMREEELPPAILEAAKDGLDLGFFPKRLHVFSINTIRGVCMKLEREGLLENKNGVYVTKSDSE
jgi:hypothetical protein